MALNTSCRATEGSWQNTWLGWMAPLLTNPLASASAIMPAPMKPID